MKTKAELINDAYSMLLQTGITAAASPLDVELALGRLNDLMDELKSRNMDTGYNVLDPDLNSPSGLQSWMNYAISSSLALRVCSDFGIEPPASLVALSNSAMSNLSARLARVNEVQYPSRAPVGSGQRWLGRFRGHYGQAAYYPNTPDTQKAVQNAVGHYPVDFGPYLQIGESIASFVYTQTSGINVTSAVQSENLVTFTIEFQASVSGQVNITATGDMGSVIPRSLDFNIAQQQQIGVV